MQAGPSVSVVMTAYGNLEFLEPALASVFQQTHSDFEVVLVDDGAKGDVQAAAGEFLPRVRYVRQQNGGLAAARNTGVREARGEFVAFCDSDDVHLPFRIAAHAYLLRSRPRAALVFSDLLTWRDGEITEQSALRARKLGPTRRSFDEELVDAFGVPLGTAAQLGTPIAVEYQDRKVYAGFVPQLIATSHIAWGGAAMYRRSAVVAVGLHDEGLRRWPDWGLSSKLSKGFELVFLDAPVLKYRQHGAQLTKNSELGAYCYHRVAYSVWKDDATFRAQHPEIHARVVHEAALQMAHIHIRHGRFSQAQQLVRDAARIKPGDRRTYTTTARLLGMRAKAALGR